MRIRNLLFTLSICLLMATSVFAANQWRGGTGEETILGTSQAADIDANSFQKIVDPLDRLLSNYREGAKIVYVDESSYTVELGEVVVSNASGSVRLMVKNTGDTTVTWANLDTGVEASSTTYYIYAVVDLTTDADFRIEMSTNSTTPDSETYYAQIGSFYNDASSNIDQNKIADATSGTPIITAIYNYATSSSSYTEITSELKIAYGSVSVAGSSSVSITNLPFTSASSYSCVASHTEAGQLLAASCDQASGSSLTVRNFHPDARVVGWHAIGN